MVGERRLDRDRRRPFPDEHGDARIAGRAFEVDVIPLAALEGQVDEAAAPRTRRDDDGPGPELVERPDFGAGANFDTGLGSCAPDRLDEPLRVDKALVGKEDAAGERAGQRRLEPAHAVGVEHLVPEALCLHGHRLGLFGAGVDAQRAGSLEAGRELVAQARVELEAREGERPNRLRPCVPVPRGQGEAHEPGHDRRARPEVERAVALPHPAQPVAERDGVADRDRMARADEARVPGRAAGSELGPALEERHLRAAARQLERAADADGAAADDDRVLRHGATLLQLEPWSRARPVRPFYCCSVPDRGE